MRFTVAGGHAAHAAFGSAVTPNLFARRGVKVDVSQDDINIIPAAERGGWILEVPVSMD